MMKPAIRGRGSRSSRRRELCEVGIFFPESFDDFDRLGQNFHLLGSSLEVAELIEDIQFVVQGLTVPTGTDAFPLLSSSSCSAVLLLVRFLLRSLSCIRFPSILLLILPSSS